MCPPYTTEASTTRTVEVCECNTRERHLKRLDVHLWTAGYSATVKTKCAKSWTAVVMTFERGWCLGKRDKWQGYVWVFEVQAEVQKKEVQAVHTMNKILCSSYLYARLVWIDYFIGCLTLDVLFHTMPHTQCWFEVNDVQCLKDMRFLLSILCQQ